MKQAGLLVRASCPFVHIPSPKMDLLLAAFVGWLMGQISCSLTPCDPEPSIETTPYPSHPVIEFPAGIEAENLNVQSNGQILVTVVNLPQVLQVDPFSLQEPYSVHQFPNPHTADALVAIVNTELDIFYIFHGNFATSTTELPRCPRLWHRTA